MKAVVSNASTSTELPAILIACSVPSPRADVLLLSCLICLLSMTHNDADAVEKQANKQKKERLKTMVPDKKD